MSLTLLEFFLQRELALSESISKNITAQLAIKMFVTELTVNS